MAVWSWRCGSGDTWIPHSANTSAALEAAHRFRERHHRRTGSVDIVAAGGRRFSADILTMTMTERDRARVGDKLFASSNGNGALRCDLRRETAEEWVARTGLGLPLADAAAEEGAAHPASATASAFTGGQAQARAQEDEDEEDDDDEAELQPGQLMKVLALEIDKPAAKVSRHAKQTDPQRPLGERAPCTAAPATNAAAEVGSSCAASSSGSESDSEDEVSLVQLRKVQEKLETSRAQLAPPLVLPRLDEVHASLSESDRRFVEFGETELLSSHRKAAAAPGVLVGDHCEAAVQVLTVHCVVTGAAKKVVWFAKNPSRLAQALRDQYAPVTGFGVHTLHNLPTTMQAGVALHGGAVCCSYRDLVTMHKSSLSSVAAQDSDTTAARHLLRWLRVDDIADVMLVFSNCDELLSRSWKGVEENKWTQIGAAFHFMQQRHPLAAVVYVSSGHRTCAAQLVHMDRLTVLWGHADASVGSSYLAAREKFAEHVCNASLRLPSRLPFWEIAIPLVCPQRVAPVLAAGQTDILQLVNAQAVEPASESELRSWTRESQKFYWDRRRKHWDKLRLAKLQSAAREAKLWDAGSAEMLRDRLLRNEFDPGSLSPPEVNALSSSPRGGTESTVELPDDLDVMNNGEAQHSPRWPQATVDQLFSTRLLELTELLFRLSDFLGLRPLSRHQLETIIDQKAQRTQAVAALTRTLFDSLLSRVVTVEFDDTKGVETGQPTTKNRRSKTPEQKVPKKRRRIRQASSVLSVQHGTAEDDDEDEEVFDVEAILDARDGSHGSREYLVKWEGFEEEEDNTWEPAVNLSNAHDLVDAFEKRKAGKTNDLMTPRYRPASDDTQCRDGEEESTRSDAFEVHHRPLEADEKTEYASTAVAAVRAAEPWESRLVTYCRTTLPDVEVEPVPAVRRIIDKLRSDGYTSLSSEQRLTLLNFIATEVLSQDDFAGTGSLLEEEGTAVDKANRIAERRLKKAAARKRTLPEHRQDAEADYFQAVNGALATRLEPLGADRWRRNYWWFQSDPGRIWVHSPLKYPGEHPTDNTLPEDRDNSWAFYDSVIQVDKLLACLDPSGARERHLSCSLKRVYRRVCRSMQQHKACSNPRVRLASAQLVEQIALDKDNGLEKDLEDQLLVADVVSDCVHKVEAVVRRQEERIAREKRREAERQAKAALLKQQKEQKKLANAQAVVEEQSPRKRPRPVVSSGWSVHWSPKHGKSYYEDDATEVLSWERPAGSRSNGGEDLVTNDDFLLGAEQVAAGVGDSHAASQFDKIHQMWVQSKAEAGDELGDVDLRQMAASRLMAYRTSWPSPDGDHVCPGSPGSPPASATEPVAEAPLAVPRSVRAAVEKILKELEREAKKAEKKLARQAQREAKEAAKRAQREAKHAERLARKQAKREEEQQQQAQEEERPRPDAPEGWTAVFSTEHDEWYFWNEDTETSVWTLPQLEPTSSDDMSMSDSEMSPRAQPVPRSVASAVERIVKKVEDAAKKVEREKERAAKKAAAKTAKKVKKLPNAHSQAALKVETTRSLSESDSDDDVPLYLRKEKLRIESQASATLQPTSFDVNPCASVHRDARTQQTKTKKSTRKKPPAAVTACMERLIKELEKPEKAARLLAQKAAKAERDAIKAEKARLRDCTKVCNELVKTVVLSFPKEYSTGDTRSMSWLKAKEQDEMLARTEKRRSSRPRKKRKRSQVDSPSDSENDDVPIMYRDFKGSKTAPAETNAKRDANAELVPSAQLTAAATVNVPLKKAKKTKNSKNIDAADDGAIGDHGSYRCVKKAVVRSDAALSSKKVGRLKPGDTFAALEVRAVEGQLRVRGPTGWASVRSLGGNRLLEKVSAVLESKNPRSAAGPQSSETTPLALQADKVIEPEGQDRLGDIAILQREEDEMKRIAKWPSDVISEVVLVAENDEVQGDAEQMVTHVAHLLNELDPEAASAPMTSPLAMPIAVFPAVETTIDRSGAPPTPARISSPHMAEDAEVAGVAAHALETCSTSAVVRPSNPTPYTQGQHDEMCRRLEHKQAQEQEKSQGSENGDEKGHDQASTNLETITPSGEIADVERAPVAPAASTLPRGDLATKQNNAKSSVPAVALPRRRVRRGFAVMESDSEEDGDASDAGGDVSISTKNKPMAEIPKTQDHICSTADGTEPKAAAATAEVQRKDSATTVPQNLVRRGSAPFLSPSAPDRSQCPDKTSGSSSCVVADVDVNDEFGDTSFLADFDVDSAVAAAAAALQGSQESAAPSTAVVD